MSQIDTNLDVVLREQLLGEVRSYLPAFLSGASVERVSHVDVASDLLKLRRQDLERVLTVHALLSAPVRQFVEALPDGIRRPITTSTRPRVAGPTVSSGVDWAATVRHRATSSPLGGVWVTRPARRVFDTPENRALAHLLRELDSRVAATSLEANKSSSNWIGEIRRVGAVTRSARRTAWLEGINTDWPGDSVYEYLQADRWGFYRGKVAPALRVVRRLRLTPTPTDVAEAICYRYFEPSQDWRLFEIAVLLRIDAKLRATSVRARPQSLIVGSGRRPFGQYHFPNHRTVRLWYQSWPRETGPSELADAIAHFELNEVSHTRPDIVVEVVDNGSTARLLLLELKATSSVGYLASGFSQLLSYLRDRPTYTQSPASGWLVSPPRALPTKEPSSRALWMTTSDEVAEAVLAVVGESFFAPRKHAGALGAVDWSSAEGMLQDTHIELQVAQSQDVPADDDVGQRSAPSTAP